MYSFVNNKPKNLPSCVTAIPTLIDQCLPPQMMRLKWIVHLIKKNVCITITATTLVCH